MIIKTVSSDCAAPCLHRKKKERRNPGNIIGLCVVALLFVCVPTKCHAHGSACGSTCQNRPAYLSEFAGNLWRVLSPYRLSQPTTQQRRPLSLFISSEYWFSVILIEKDDRKKIARIVRDDAKVPNGDGTRPSRKRTNVWQMDWFHYY